MGHPGLAIAYPPGADVTVTYAATLEPSELLRATPAPTLKNTRPGDQLRVARVGRPRVRRPDRDRAGHPGVPAPDDGEDGGLCGARLHRVAVHLAGRDDQHGTAPAFGIDITDTIPAGWEYVPGTSQLTTPSAPAAAHADPVIIAGVAVWSDLGTLQPGQAAKHDVPAPADHRGPAERRRRRSRRSTAPARRVRTRRARPGNVDGPYDNGEVQAQTHIDKADLQVTKTHASPVVAGGNATWTLTVKNNGPDPAVGPFAITDTLPPGTGFVSASGHRLDAAPRPSPASSRARGRRRPARSRPGRRSR